MIINNLMILDISIYTIGVGRFRILGGGGGQGLEYWGGGGGQGGPNPSRHMTSY